MSRWIVSCLCLVMMGGMDGWSAAASASEEIPNDPSRYRLCLREGQTETGTAYGPHGIYLTGLGGPFEERHKQFFIEMSFERHSQLKALRDLSVREVLERRRNECQRTYHNLLTQALQIQSMKMGTMPKNTEHLLTGTKNLLLNQDNIDKPLAEWLTQAANILNETASVSPSDLITALTAVTKKWKTLPRRESISIKESPDERDARLNREVETLNAQLDQLTKDLSLLGTVETEWTRLIDREKNHMLTGRAVWGAPQDQRGGGDLLGLIIPIPHGPTDIEIKILWKGKVDETQLGIAWLASLSDLFCLPIQEACTTLWSEGEMGSADTMFALWRKIGFRGATKTSLKRGLMRVEIKDFWIHLAGVWEKLEQPSIVEDNPHRGQINLDVIKIPEFLEMMSKQEREFNVKWGPGAEDSHTLRELYKLSVERELARKRPTD